MRLLEARILAAIGISVILATMLILNIVGPHKVERKPFPEKEKKWLAERMRYHGITQCIKDETGIYFIRNGKRCEL